MIKHINPQNILLSPFIAAKGWALSNTLNPDIIVLEQDETIGIALEYIDYNYGTPILNRDCNIALEQQGVDAVQYEAAATGSRIFDNQSAIKNQDGTYQNLVYNTVKNLFYNTYNDPTKIFGVEHIDFPLSNTLRNLTDEFRLFSLSSKIFGDKIQPKSITLHDELFDDNVTIFDDGNQNLIAGFNLFSKVQEVRTYPAGFNPQTVLSGTASISCPTYNNIQLTHPNTVYVNPGANITFSVSSSGLPLPISYQWWVVGNSTPLSDNYPISASSLSGSISGSNGPTLYIYNVDEIDNSNGYYVTAWNTSSAMATSSIASLHIIPPTITLNPSNQSNWTTLDSIFWSLPQPSFSPTITASFTASFTVSASAGNNFLTYQWYFNSVPLVDNDRITGSYVFSSSLSGSLLQINALQFSDVGNYYCGVTDKGGTSYSNDALLTVWDNTISRSLSDTMSYDSSVLFGSTQTVDPYTEGTIPSFAATLLSGQVNETIFSISANETASISTAFDVGSIFDTIVIAYGGNETASVSTAFDSGLLFDVLVSMGEINETASISTVFDNGYLTTLIGAVINDVESPSTFAVTFLTGSVV